MAAARILIVDDDPDTQRVLGYTLKQEGFQVLVAVDGAEALRVREREKPDLILLDIMLPKLDGYQVAERIRAEEGSVAHVPIVMVTAETDIEQKVRGLRAGADDYLVKPFHPAELLARIRSLLARFAPRVADTTGHAAAGRVLAFYGAKGGVGTTTLAINAAIALQRDQGRRVVLVDGNLQFGDHRVFLDLGLDRKSIVDVVVAPTIDQDLLKSVLIHHDTGIDLLLAPPSPEMAELVNADQHHMTQIIELLRQRYDYVIVDIDKRLDETNLDVISASDVVFVVMTADLSCLKNVRLVLETMSQLGMGSGARPARPEPLDGLHRHHRQERGERAPPTDRVPGRQRLPRRDHLRSTPARRSRSRGRTPRSASRWSSSCARPIAWTRRAPMRPSWHRRRPDRERRPRRREPPVKRIV